MSGSGTRWLQQMARQTSLYYLRGETSISLPKTSSLSQFSLQLSVFDDSDPDILNLDDFDDIVGAIKIFQKIVGDVSVPLRFEVPAEANWPARYHGLKLGRRLERLATSRSFQSQHRDKVRVFVFLCPYFPISLFIFMSCL